MKAYFDVQWKGPVVEVDSNGNVTKTGTEDVGKFFSLAQPPL